MGNKVGRITGKSTKVEIEALASSLALRRAIHKCYSAIGDLDRLHKDKETENVLRVLSYHLQDIDAMLFPQTKNGRK